MTHLWYRRRAWVGVAGCALLLADWRSGLAVAQPLAQGRLLAGTRTAIAPARAPSPPLPRSSLALRVAGERREWWRSDSAPARWSASQAMLARAVRWRHGDLGVEWGELALSGHGEAWRTRVIVARIDPRFVALRLDTAFAGNRLRARPSWTTTRAANDAAIRFAMNAGQFVFARPWGLVVLAGREWQRAGSGPLAATLLVDADGAVRLVHADDLARTDRAGVAWGFQSYPALLRDGEIPEPLRRADAGVDVAHRDARAAIGVDAAGRLLALLTRFDVRRLGAVPFGLTVPEVAAVMGALGARDAMLLDGGISAQMLLRDARGRTRSWPGLRPVPLALVATRRR